MINPFNTQTAFESITDYWSPKIIGELNGQYVKIAKLKGEFVWHKHENEDELFLIIKGNLTIELKDSTVQLKEGDGYIVPKNILHNPHCQKECWVMLMEPKETLHTGNVKVDETKSIEDQLR
jgi:mannose-6-phosphate isomerase-like protein (cupin superfamily)